MRSRFARQTPLALVVLFLAATGCGGAHQEGSAVQGKQTEHPVGNAGDPTEGPLANAGTANLPLAFANEPPISLLSDRLTIRMPVGARALARPHSIMAADQPSESETRVMLDAGAERFVVMTYESFERVSEGKDAEAAVRAAVKRDFGKDASPSPLSVSDSKLKVWTVKPPSIDRNREAILVLAAYVLGPDGFVQTLSFYVNPPSAKESGCAAQLATAKLEADSTEGELPGCVKLARAVAQTLRAGSRALDLSAGARKLQGQYGDDTFVATVPAGTNVTTQKGPDFTVHSVRLPVELGAESSPSLGVYIGGHPSFQYTQMDAPVKPTSKAGNVFGKAVAWQVWPVNQTRIMAEVIVPHPKSKGIMVHLFAGASDEKELGPLLTMASTLKLP